LQETKAELQYSQALQYLSKDKLDEAEKQLSQLLQSEIIISVSLRKLGLSYFEIKNM